MPPEVKDTMQILQTGTYKIKSKIKNQNVKLRKSVHCSLFTIHCFRGFTFIELVVVIFILSFATALIMPSFWETEKDAVKTEAKHLSSALRYIYDNAVKKKQIYSFNVNLDNESWGFKSKKETRNFKTKGNAEIRDIIAPSLGEVSNGEVTIEFGPMGPEEPIILHLRKGKSEYTIILNHLDGRTKIFEGYIL